MRRSKMRDQSRAFDVNEKRLGTGCTHGLRRLGSLLWKRNDVTHLIELLYPLTHLKSSIVSEYGHKGGIFSVNVPNAGTVKG